MPLQMFFAGQTLFEVDVTAGGAGASFTQSQFIKVKAGILAAESRAPNLFLSSNTIRIEDPDTATSVGIAGFVAGPGAADGTWSTARIGISGLWVDSAGTEAGPSYINENGNRILMDIERIVVHEMTHNNNGGPTLPLDPTLDQFRSIVSGNAATASPDATGPVVESVNGIYDASNQRMDYFGFFSGRLVEGFEGDSVDPDLIAFRARESFTDGNEIDLLIHDSTFGPGDGVLNGVDTRSYTSEPNDLIFGYLGNDTIRSGSGNDYIYGGGLGTTSSTLGVVTTLSGARLTNTRLMASTP